MKLQMTSLCFLIAALTSCNPNLNPMTLGQHLKNQNQNENINQVPAELEQPDIDDVAVPEQKTNPEPSVKAETKSETKKEASKFIQTAYNVMVREGRALGTACNVYLQRVLVRSGFPQGHFVANDFDMYAKKYFKSYKTEDFKIDSTRSDKADLKKYLWSYDERTPFIVQWTRPGYYGHVAIMERIGENLIIYQASIGNHTARRDQTTIEQLLSSRRRAHLTVYSDFR